MQYDIDETGKLINARRKEKVMRCKDCAHWKHSTVRPSYCEVWDWQNAENDYCSFAERKISDT